MKTHKHTHRVWRSLHELDVRLCEYIRTNVREHLEQNPLGRIPAIRRSAKRPMPNTFSPRKPRRDRLARYRAGSLKERFTRNLEEGLHPRLLKFLVKSNEEHAAVPPNEDETRAVASTIEDQPLTGCPFKWRSWPPPHTQTNAVLLELRDLLGETELIHISSRLKTFQALESDKVPIADGIHRVGEALWVIRQMLRDAQREDFLPARRINKLNKRRIEGRIPSPTCDPDPPQLPESDRKTLEWLQERIRQHPLGKRASTTDLYQGSGRRKTTVLCLLRRYLVPTGEWESPRPGRRK